MAPKGKPSYYLIAQYLIAQVFGFSGNIGENIYFAFGWRGKFLFPQTLSVWVMGVLAALSQGLSFGRK